MMSVDPRSGPPRCPWCPRARFGPCQNAPHAPLQDQQVGMEKQRWYQSKSQVGSARVPEHHSAQASDSEEKKIPSPEVSPRMTPRQNVIKGIVGTDAI